MKKFSRNILAVFSPFLTGYIGMMISSIIAKILLTMNVEDADWSVHPIKALFIFGLFCGVSGYASMETSHKLSNSIFCIPELLYVITLISVWVAFIPNKYLFNMICYFIGIVVYAIVFYRKEICNTNIRKEIVPKDNSDDTQVYF